jgi:AhpD family alkylhydroperoxidase
MTFDNRTTALIAIGASVAANCQSCAESHLAQAAEYGIEQNEVAQAVEIGRMVRRGAAASVDRAVDRLLHKDASATNSATGDRPSAGESACCGSAFTSAAAGEPGGAPTSFATRCAPFASMAAGWSGEFPFRGCQNEAKR